MKTISYKTVALLFAASIAFTGCERRSLNDCQTASVQIPVSVDWSQSNITPTSRNGGDFVHRVSIRFFPRDGSPAFDRYLEGNVFEGYIDVPVGDYSVVVFNESIYDPYWSDAIFFSDSDDYDSFAANLVEDNPANYAFYTPDEGETLSKEPLKLASWSLDDFRVTPSTAAGSDPMYYALTGIVLQRLTYQAQVTAAATNLNAAQQVYGILKNLPQKVYMASGQVVSSAASHVFPMNLITWDDQSQTDGTASTLFLTFGKQPDQAAIYWQAIAVYLKSGTLYEPPQPFLFDVSDQVHANQDANIQVTVSIELPQAEEGVDVGDWDDIEIPIL